MKPPRVFISYSHDSEQHDLRVLEFSNRLRQDGIDAFLDRYEVAPSQGWSEWSAEQMAAADFVLLICTDTYRARFESNNDFESNNERAWGVAFEANLVLQEIYNNKGKNVKYIPVILGDSLDVIPAILRTYTYYRYPDGYEEIYRRLTNNPAISVPPLGKLSEGALPERKLPITRVHSKGAVTPETELPFLEKGNTGLNARHLTELRRIWLEKRLSVIAGAGVSVEAKLPSWINLLRELLAAYVRKTYAVGEEETALLLTELQQQLEVQSPLIYAQFVRSQFTNAEFTELVHKVLYPSATRPQPGKLCQAIARLGTHINSILTFNYDELLEDALLVEGYTRTTIFNAEGWASVSGIPVYHPHGFLPFQLESGVDYKVVLAEGDYHTQYHSPNIWSNIAISRVLLESSCLFVGVSLTDPNLRRLLDAAHREQPKKSHYMLARSPVPVGALSGGIIAQAVPEVFAASYQQLGVTPIWFNEFSEIPAIIDSIRDLRGR